MRLFVIAAACAVAAVAAPNNYTAETLTIDGVQVIRLRDAARNTEVSIAPQVGNTAYEMKVNGKNIFWFPYQSVGQFKNRPIHLGNPFLAPWANRIQGDTYWVNGKKYHLNPDLRNVSFDQNHNAIHGVVGFSPEWKVIRVKADKGGAETTSRLEFWRNAGWMAQFPFAHTIEMTHRLQDGVLQVETVIENLSTEPLPVAIGYHPYFTLDDAPRDEWEVHLAAREHFTTGRDLIPTGTEPIKYSDPQPLKGIFFDDGFTNLVRDETLRAEFWVKGKNQKISVVYGRQFPVAVVYAPPMRKFVCFEPMTAPTNAFNMAHDGKFDGLQTIAPGDKWMGSFWIKASGF